MGWMTWRSLSGRPQPPRGSRLIAWSICCVPLYHGGVCRYTMCCGETPPAARQHSTFLERPMATRVSVRKIVKSSKEVVTVPPSFWIAVVYVCLRSGPARYCSPLRCHLTREKMPFSRRDGSGCHSARVARAANALDDMAGNRPGRHCLPRQRIPFVTRGKGSMSV
jgi:hypothetical protein